MKVLLGPMSLGLTPPACAGGELQTTASTTRALGRPGQPQTSGGVWVWFEGFGKLEGLEGFEGF